MKVLLLGSTGQVGTVLKNLINDRYKMFSPTRGELDLYDLKKVKNYITNIKPNWILNCAAYTDVEVAEYEHDKAMILNADLPKVLANSALEVDSCMLHLSTDHVFDGNYKGYIKEDHKINPLNFYGKTKALGETNIRKILPKHLILRTSWIYSDIRKFFLTIQNLLLKGKKIYVVKDQIGSPTSNSVISNSIKDILIGMENRNFSSNNKMKIWGTYNLSCKGQASWYEFAREIALALNYDVDKKVYPISSDNYKSNVKRPKNSVLSIQKFERKFKISLPYWKEDFYNKLKSKDK